MGTVVADDNQFGLGDLAVDPLVLSWYAKRWDAFFAAGCYMPTGDHDDPASPGKGYWTFVYQGGATYYFDAQKTWSFSGRGRFLHSTEDPDTDITPGNEVILEYGFGKEVSLKNGYKVAAGVIGYSYYQLTEDSGSGASDLKMQGHALGPEIQVSVFDPFYLNLSLRYLHEYGVENNTQGDSVCFTITTSF